MNVADTGAEVAGQTEGAELIRWSLAIVEGVIHLRSIEAEGESSFRRVTDLAFDPAGIMPHLGS